MKTVCIRIILLGGLMSLALIAAAQPYTTAVGLRLGYPSSITAKHFLSENGALEGYLGTRGYLGLRWYNLSAAYLHHFPLEIEEIENLNWYVGGGASAFLWSYDLGFYGGGSGFSSTTLGVQGYIGLDYTFGDIPLNLTLDWSPTLFVGNGYFGGFGAGYGSLGVRYLLK